MNRSLSVTVGALALLAHSAIAAADPPTASSSAPPANVVVGNATHETPPPPPPPPPFVREEPGTSLWLRDGTVLTGRVTELRPDQFVIIETRPGVPRVIAWRDIARASGASFPRGYVAYTPPPGYEPPHTEPLPGQITLSFASTGSAVAITPGFVIRNGVLVRSMDVPGGAICRTPCTAFAYPGPVSYSVSGYAGRQASIRTTLGAGTNRFVLQPAETWRDGVGLALEFSGDIIFAGGGILLFYGAFGNSSGSPSVPFIAAGASLMGVGLSAAAAGLALYFTNRPHLVSRPEWSVSAAPFPTGGAGAFVTGSF